MVTPLPQHLAAFVDSSALVSLVDRDDYTHRAAVDAYESLKSEGYRLFTSNHVVAETYDLLAGSLGNEIARSWLDEMGLPIYVADANDLEQARDRVLASRKPHQFQRCAKRGHHATAWRGRCVRRRSGFPGRARLISFAFERNTDDAGDCSPASFPLRIVADAIRRGLVQREAVVEPRCVELDRRCNRHGDRPRTSDCCPT